MRINSIFVMDIPEGVARKRTHDKDIKVKHSHRYPNDSVYFL